MARKFVADRLEPADAHIEASRPPDLDQVRECVVVDRGFALCRVLVAGDDRDRRSDLAVGDGDARGGGRSDARGDAGDDLAADASPCAERRLFRATAKEVRVAALEPDHTLALLRKIDEQLIGLVLRELVVLGPLADVVSRRVLGRLVQ